MIYTVALFGEAQKGEFRKPYYFETLPQLSEQLGEPPSAHSKGLYFAIQALLLDYGVIFFRVHEEGFSINDYIRGLSLLENTKHLPHLAAIGLPGVGNSEILEATTPICEANNSLLIITEKDLYDYFTYGK